MGLAQGVGGVPGAAPRVGRGRLGARAAARVAAAGHGGGVRRGIGARGRGRGGRKRVRNGGGSGCSAAPQRVWLESRVGAGAAVGWCYINAAATRGGGGGWGASSGSLSDCVCVPNRRPAGGAEA